MTLKEVPSVVIVPRFANQEIYDAAVLEKYDELVERADEQEGETR